MVAARRWALAGFLLAFVLALPVRGAVVFETDWLSIRIDDTGAVRGMLDRRAGVNYGVSPQPAPLLALRIGGQASRTDWARRLAEPYSWMQRQPDTAGSSTPRRSTAASLWAARPSGMDRLTVVLHEMGHVPRQEGHLLSQEFRVMMSLWHGGCSGTFMTSGPPSNGGVVLPPGQG